MEDNNIDIRERLVAVESSLKSEHKRLDHLEEVVENIREMTAEIRHIREDVNVVVNDVQEIKQKPAKRWDSVIAAVLGALGGGIGAALIAMFMR